MEKNEWVAWTSVCLQDWQFHLATTQRGLCLVAVDDSDEQFIGDLQRRYPQASVNRRDHELSSYVKELAQYLAGVRSEFDLPLDIEGTPFQLQTWRALSEIPYGETRTYGQVARTIGRPQAARAVGGACNKNPVMLFVPCHRVVGSNGSLVGFGGGLALKRALLKLEQAALPGKSG